MSFSRLGYFHLFLKKTLEAVFTMLMIATLTFTLLRYLPGGPFDGERALPPEIRQSLEQKYGIDQSLSTQYVRYMNGLVHGDLGESYKYLGQSVTEIIGEKWPVSLQLGLFALVFAFVLGIPIGVISATRHHSILDRGLMVFAISGLALPSFIVGPLLILVFSFGVPFAAFRDLLPAALWDGPSYYILPVITLGLRPAAMVARMIRASVLDVLQEDFIRTAKAKGVPDWRVLFKHVLKNSILPTLAMTGPLLAGLLSGSFVVEVIFGIPGLGKDLIQSVSSRDYPLALGLTLVFSLLLVISNLIIDFLYSIVDPRMKSS